MNSTQLGFVRGISMAVLIAVLSYIGDASHLNGLLSESIAGIVAAIALSVEHYVESQTGNALFGAVESPVE